MRGTGESTPEHEMRLVEISLMKYLHQPISEINKMSVKQVQEYVIIIDEITKIQNEKLKESQNV